MARPIRGSPKQIACVVFERSLVLVETKVKRTAIDLPHNFDIGLGCGPCEMGFLAVEEPRDVGEPGAERRMFRARRHVGQRLVCSTPKIRRQGRAASIREHRHGPERLVRLLRLKRHSGRARQHIKDPRGRVSGKSPFPPIARRPPKNFAELCAVRAMGFRDRRFEIEIGEIIQGRARPRRDFRARSPCPHFGGLDTLSPRSSVSLAFDKSPN